MDFKGRGGDTRWIKSDTLSVRISNQLFYVEPVIFTANNRPDVKSSYVYQPLSVSGDKVFVREIIRDSLKMMVLAEYASEARASAAVPTWRQSR